MKTKFSPSINIIRDSGKDFNYIVTENAELSAIKIINDFQKGFHSFSIIGSYGTGKSSFLMAFEKSLTKNKKLFNLKLPKHLTNVAFVNFVGNYNSLKIVLKEHFNIKKDFANNQKLFSEIFNKYNDLGKNGLLVLAIDEFGKFLEYAANNNPEKEMYFIQQLTEFVNDPDRNIILLTTLHQGLETYAYKLNDTQKNEWRKVKGRLKEITFNEPIEQLLNLAVSFFKQKGLATKESGFSKSLIKIQKTNYVLAANNSFLESLKNQIYPLDIFSAFILTSAIQRYGQNERSLFTFLEDEDFLNRKGEMFSIEKVYDYLFLNYYNLIKSKTNIDYNNWTEIKDALQRSETVEKLNLNVAEAILKTIGLLHIFSSKAAQINLDFLNVYLKNQFDKKTIKNTIDLLVKASIIKYVKFRKSYKIFEGTDLDIEKELFKAENKISSEVDIVVKLNSNFPFPILMAKAVSYKKGTSRLFEYVISEEPINTTPNDEVDGFLNLIFNTKIDVEKIKKHSKKNKNAILYCYYLKSDTIKTILYEIEKTEQVLKSIENDKVAEKEVQSILRSNKNLLNHYVLNDIYNKEKVVWLFNGKRVEINNPKQLNEQLSAICEAVYFETPIIKNELFNKHKVAGAITSSRKVYFKALVNDYTKADLGFEKSKFPPEKNIYYSLLKSSGMHDVVDGEYVLKQPNKSSTLSIIWKLSEAFLNSAKEEKKSIVDLINQLKSAPIKLKQGVIDLWIPTFLFIRRGDFALYANDKFKGDIFKQELNEQELFLIVRNPEAYKVKSFELNDLRITFFNKYRVYLNQEKTSTLNTKSFIESVKPILAMYKKLPLYNKQTTKLSKESIAFRKAIENAKELDNLFFNAFPKALGYNVKELLKSDNYFDAYIYKFQNVIDEIRSAYKELLVRIEKFVAMEIVGSKSNFEVYQGLLIERYTTLKEHQLTKKQVTFLARIKSEIDKESWLNSLAQTIIGKTANVFLDGDEEKFKDGLIFSFKELDNLVSIGKVKIDATKEELIKLDITTNTSGLKTEVIRIQYEKMNKAKKQINEINKCLGKNKQLRIAILAKMLKQELDNE